MPPIPIYTESPITAAAGAEAATPKTAEPPANRGIQPPPAPATTTAAAYAPPAAQPGAVPRLPQPTGVAMPHNGYGQPYGNAPAPTPTTTTRPVDNGPPPPQPGAVPHPPTASAANQTAGAGPQYWSAAPAPAAAPAAAPPTTTMPPQMAMAPISANQFTVPRGTAPATPAYGYQPQHQQQPSYTYGYPQQQGPEAAQQGCHPPGYAQNSYVGAWSEPERSRSRAPVLYDDGSDEGFWSATKKLAATAGSKLTAAESEVWRRINGDN